MWCVRKCRWPLTVELYEFVRLYQAFLGFLIVPNEITYYEADEKEPWSYAWIGFNGTKALEYLHFAGLTEQNKIFSINNSDKIYNYFLEMLQNKRHSKDCEIKLTGLLYLIISELISNSNNTLPISFDNYNNIENYIKKAVYYIQGNYSRGVTIKEISEFVGLDRSYFG